MSEVKSVLLLLHSKPRHLGRLVDRTRQKLPEWLPALISIAGAGHQPESSLAVTVLDALVSPEESTDFLLDFYEQLPRKSSATASIATQLMEILISRYGGETSSRDLSGAMLWNNYSERCQDNNRPAAALRCAETAVELCRRTPKGDRSGKRVKVICQLTLAKRYAEHGRRDEAMKMAAQARTLAARLARSGVPEDVLLEAQAQINFANRLAAQGRLASAIKAAKSGLEKLSGELENPEFRMDLAIAELTIANALTRLGRHEESLTHADIAERLFRVMTGHEPDQYLEYAAAAANTYSINLSQLGNLELAHDLAHRCVERMVVLARRHPLRFGLEYANYLIGFANIAGELGLHDEALGHAKEAIREIRRVSRMAKQKYPYLEGTALMNLFHLQYRRRDFAGAKGTVRAACKAFESLPDSHPEALPETVRSLRNLAEILRVTAKPGRVHHALKAARKAVDLATRLPKANSESSRQLAAQCHSTLAHCLEESGQVREAIAEERRSLSLRKKLYQQSALVYRPDLAYAHLNLARRLLKTGALPEAQRLAERSVTLYEQALPSAPDRISQFLPEALRALSDVQLAKREDQRSMETLVRAIRFLRPLYEKSPSLWRDNLLPLCAVYGQRASELGVPFDESLVRDVIEDAMSAGAS